MDTHSAFHFHNRTEQRKGALFLSEIKSHDIARTKNYMKWYSSFDGFFSVDFFFAFFSFLFILCGSQAPVTGAASGYLVNVRAVQLTLLALNGYRVHV